ncbi:LysE family translocator [Mongoliibacter ruber]|uniref:Threonine/homoserine/homoserine lactone efflux protein n=1 Tax=Mongoliibacter ruber TaxID=1750599 RepID=A0A2T0WMY9_9BACT|nr:LysE family translocator [Mongoliibacter ruber]PRY88055.1 threonine/homoserine/homoserine lactone efflux protein [Mongoliibacter ruber]
MIEALLEGIGMGLVLSAMIGPVFFALITNSIENGFRHTVILALGILCSDLIYVMITYFGVSIFSQNPNFEIVLGYAGGLILMAFGATSFVKKNNVRPNSGGMPLPKTGKAKGFFKGFGINGVNPFVLLFWISIAGLVSLKDHFDKVDVTIYYAGILVTVFSIDLLKAFVAKQLRSFITPRFMKLLNRVVGILLVLFGLRLIYFAMERQGLM